MKKLIVCTYIFLLLANRLISQTTISVNVDLGGSETVLPWNTLNNSNNGELINLIGSNGFETEIDLSITDGFTGTNTNGTQNADPALGYPAFASGDSFFGNAIEWNGATNESAAVLLSDLEPNTTYQLSLFASREASDNRETQYTISSGNLDTIVFLDVASNTDKVITLPGLVADENNEINIQLTAGPNNNNSAGFFYLGVLQLQFEAEEVDTEPRLSLLSQNGGQYYQSGKQPQIRWSSKNIAELILEYSTDNGSAWETIDTVNAFAQRYDWTVPDASSEDCLIRVSSPDLTQTSESSFVINNADTTDCHIVVLGSSTAAGTGPSSLDSAWVWRYRDTTFQNDTRFTITNLARGGFTTYNILPDNANIPMGVNQAIDTARNISQALSLNPNAIIINLPSNDAANGYSVADQLANYDLIIEDLIAMDIPFWIATPQPRNNFSETQKQIQLDMRDSTFARFDEFAIDFWTGLATAESNVDSGFDSGDGVHLNNAGHRILLDRVLGSEIPSFLIDKKNEGTNSQRNIPFFDLEVFPNPTAGAIKIKNLQAPYSIFIYNTSGTLLSEYKDYNSDVLQLSQDGMQLIKIVKEKKVYISWVNKL